MRTDVNAPHPSPENLAGKLDAKGRCCGRKPLDYKGSWRSTEPQKFCCRCDRAYDRVTGEQIENFAFSKCEGCGCWIKGGEQLCGECACEDDCAP